MTAHARTLDVLVIGAGQAGLALGVHLKKTPFRFQLVDRHAWVGDSRRNRYASLVLFTPRD
jgi:putative flavoprotein involved in K+ transport